MDSFLKRFFPSVYAQESNFAPTSNQYCKFNSQILTLFTSSLYLTALIAGLAASWITRQMGRRATMIIGGLFFVSGALLNGLAVSMSMLIVGRMLLGFGIGCANQVIRVLDFCSDSSAKLSNDYYLICYILCSPRSQCPSTSLRWPLISTEEHLICASSYQSL